MKNPCNPVFANESQYSIFRAKFAIWVPSLKTLDGTDFKDDQEQIKKIIVEEQAKKDGGGQIEESKGSSSDNKGGKSMDKTIKAQSGTTAFQYNQKAHKKYSSHRSLVDRILKSHSEGNRFIRNDDL